MTFEHHNIIPLPNRRAANNRQSTSPEGKATIRIPLRFVDIGSRPEASEADYKNASIAQKLSQTILYSALDELHRRNYMRYAAFLHEHAYRAAARGASVDELKVIVDTTCDELGRLLRQ